MRLLLIIVGLTLLLTPTLVNAQSASPSPFHQIQPRTVGEEHKQEVEKRHNQVQEHLKQVKNRHHAQIAEKIHQNLNHVNTTLTTAWSHHLSKMSEILIKLEDHLNQAAKDGKDVANTQAALNNAKQAVTTAENALNSQADKTYTFNISNPDHIGSDIQAARDTLHNDLKTVHETLKNAKEAVVEATKAVNQLVGGSHEGQ